MRGLLPLPYYHLDNLRSTPGSGDSNLWKIALARFTPGEIAATPLGPDLGSDKSINFALHFL